MFYVKLVLISIYVFTLIKVNILYSSEKKTTIKLHAR